ncbi:MAG: sigma-70 family RNA polymerase sigma factor [Longimicrobiales bacterium]
MIAQERITAADSEALTELLAQASGGNSDALNRLFPLVYEELKRVAMAQLRSEREGHTLNATALVHEVYLKLIDQTRVEWQNRAHFFAIASRAMRRILVNYAEMKKAEKRGGGAVHVALDEAGVVLTDPQLEDLLALDQALERLRTFNPRGAEVVVCRFFGGLSWEEIADVVGMSPVTVRRAWVAAKSWLHRELAGASPGPAEA